MLKALRRSVCDANKKLPSLGLVTLTWGNVSGIDRSRGLVVIKPSGVAYDDLTPDDMVIVDMSGAVAEGQYNPSSDTATHLRLYEAFPEIGGVCHTHSTLAAAFAQAGCPIPAYGTTHADHFYGDVPCSRALTESEINGAYELETGNVIVETFAGLDPMAVPAALVRSHGPFTWGLSAAAAVTNAVALEEVARLALNTQLIARAACQKTPPRIERTLLDRHYRRKHGEDATYGQR